MIRILYKIIRIFLIIFFLLNCLVTTETKFLIFSTIPVFLLTLSFSHQFLLKIKLLIFISLLCWGAIFYLAATETKENLKEIPLTETYVNDELLYLKTFYLYRQTREFYPSLFKATIESASQRHLSTDFLTWRWPTIFVIWSVFAKSGVGIQNLYIIFSLFSLLAASTFLVKKLEPSLALLGGLLLMPYFLDGLIYKTSFLFTEWWGLFFFLYGLAFLVKKKNLLASLLITLSVITREIFILPVLFLIFASLLMKKKSHFANAKVYILPLIIFSLLMYSHRQNVINFSLALEFRGSPSSRLHFFDKQLFLRMISFSMRHYLMAPFFVNKIFLVLSTISAIIALLRKKASFFLPFFAFLIFGISLAFIGVYDNDYWGIAFMPFLIFSSVYILKLTTIQITVRQSAAKRDIIHRCSFN